MGPQLAWTVGRIMLTWAGSFTVSLLVADYVVKAHFASQDSTNGAFAASLDNLNNTMLGLDASIRATNSELSSLGKEISELRLLVERQGGQLVALQTEMSKMQDAVQGAGIDIEASAVITKTFDPSSAVWSAVRAKYGISDQDPVFLEIAPLPRPEQPN